MGFVACGLRVSGVETTASVSRTFSLFLQKAEKATGDQELFLCKRQFFIVISCPNEWYVRVLQMFCRKFSIVVYFRFKSKILVSLGPSQNELLTSFIFSDVDGLVEERLVLGNFKKLM